MFAIKLLTVVHPWLQALLQAFREERLFSSSSPSSSFPLLHPLFQQHANDQEHTPPPPGGPAQALKRPADSDVWAAHFAQFWVDYEVGLGLNIFPEIGISYIPVLF